jgi:cytochrome c-type biogenesis protein CcmH
VERDLARGVLTPEDAERTRTEVSRRILAADAKAQGGAAANAQPKPLTYAAAALATLALLAGGGALYSALGAPGYGDLGLKDRIDAANAARANRPSQAAAEAQVPPSPAMEVSPDYAELVEKLRSAIQERPDDVQGLTLLARSEAALGNYKASYEAHARLVQVLGDEATAEDYADLGGMMVLAAGGYVSPEAQKAIEAALTRDRNNGAARYYGGLMMAQTGRPDVAFRMWRDLMNDSAPTDPWMGPIRQQIEELAFLAGVNNFTLPPEDSAPMIALPGPSQEDMANAADMSDEDRQQMIQGMVERLSERLATEGGSPEEWSRLIGAYGVLGDTDQARAIWNEAQLVFGQSPQALAIVRAGAQRAGVAE